MVGPGDEPPVDPGPGTGPRRLAVPRRRRRAAPDSVACESQADPADGGDRPLLTFRLDPALWRDVRAQLAVDRRTLSDVVNQGLTDYVGRAAADGSASARRRRCDLGGRAAVDLTLPSDISHSLQELRATGRGKLLSATLAHLHDIGWPLRTLAEALGVSRQAVQARVRQDVPSEIRASVGELDMPPTYPRQRQPVGPGVRRRPSTVQVDVELRREARSRADAEGLSLTQVVESIVRRYLDGAVGHGEPIGPDGRGTARGRGTATERLDSTG